MCEKQQIIPQRINAIVGWLNEIDNKRQTLVHTMHLSVRSASRSSTYENTHKEIKIRARAKNELWKPQNGTAHPALVCVSQHYVITINALAAITITRTNKIFWSFLLSRNVSESSLFNSGRSFSIRNRPFTRTMSKWMNACLVRWLHWQFSNHRRSDCGSNNKINTLYLVRWKVRCPAARLLVEEQNCNQFRFGLYVLFCNSQVRRGFFFSLDSFDLHNSVYLCIGISEFLCALPNLWTEKFLVAIWDILRSYSMTMISRTEFHSWKFN